MLLSKSYSCDKAAHYLLHMDIEKDQFLLKNMKNISNSQNHNTE